MTPIAKFHSYVVALTVALMFFAVSLVTKLVPDPSNTSIAAGVALAGFGSVGLYRVLATMFLLLLAKWEFLLRFTLGPYYVKGTWAGLVRTKTGKPLLIVEKFEQSLEHLTVRGWSYLPDDTVEANWTTQSAQVEAKKGELFCFYHVNVPYKENVVEALGRLQFDRPDDKTGPTKMTGYTVDTDATQKLRYEDLHKLSDDLLGLDKAKRMAFDHFEERLTAAVSSLE